MKRHRPGPALAVLVALTLGIDPDPAAGYPIPPVPLWELVEQADLIVLARVESVTLRTFTRAELAIPTRMPISTGTWPCCGCSRPGRGR